MCHGPERCPEGVRPTTPAAVGVVERGRREDREALSVGAVGPAERCSSSGSAAVGSLMETLEADRTAARLYSGYLSVADDAAGHLDRLGKLHAERVVAVQRTASFDYAVVPPDHDGGRGRGECYAATRPAAAPSRRCRRSVTSQLCR